jgi:GST-like protein
VDLNPNSKISARIDDDAVKPVRIFESGAISLFLVEKFSRFIPLDVAGRIECMSWLLWQVGSAAYLGVFFAFLSLRAYQVGVAIDGFTMEAKRQLHVLD